ncbi:IS200/IS605 family element transposase accessory protein TnpB [Halonotius sp. F2-221B]|uniref:RNA-guided endonuclease InsQ/TnpB family protein n=1 Tax=Halonotius sp. F2-221B TaxID=2731620 RepID=UPI00398AF762
MKQTAEKTVVAKILTDDLTQSKLDAINHEYEAFQQYIRGDENADLYSATKQCADAYVDTDNLRDDHDYPWFIRNDVFDVGVDVEQHDTNLTDWWLKLPVSQVWGGVNVPIQPHDEIPDEADVKDSKIVREDGDYYAHLTVRQEVEVGEEYDGVIGVDFGVRWVATSVALPSRNTEFYGREIRRIRRHHHDLRTRLQEKGAYDTLQSVKAKEYRRVNDRLHKISRAIVEEAKERNALIVVGNLEGIQNQDLGAEMNRRLHSMPHHTLKNYIEYKATFAGIVVRSVNEYMTSQTCWRCGEQEATTRKGQGQHLCHECGLDDNADKNGATNIAKKGLGKDIACPLSSLGAVCEPALEPGGADQASATVRLRADLEAPASTKRAVRRAK